MQAIPSTPAQRALLTLTHPARAFTPTPTPSSAWLPYLLLILASFAFIATIGASVGWNTVARNNLAASPKQQARLDQLPPAQRDAQIAVIARVSRISGFITSPVLPLLAAALAAAVLLAILNFAFGGEARFGPLLPSISFPPSPPSSNFSSSSPSSWPASIPSPSLSTTLSAATPPSTSSAPAPPAGFCPSSAGLTSLPFGSSSSSPSAPQRSPGSAAPRPLSPFLGPRPSSPSPAPSSLLSPDFNNPPGFTSQSLVYCGTLPQSQEKASCSS